MRQATSEALSLAGTQKSRLSATRVDPMLLLDDLKQAENNVLFGELRIQRQREVLDRLRLQGHDTAEAEATLGQLMELQAVVIAHRDWLVQACKPANDP